MLMRMPMHTVMNSCLRVCALASCSYSCELVDEEGRDMGMLLYSSQGGWSSMDKESGDPRPANMDPAVSGLQRV